MFNKLRQKAVLEIIAWNIYIGTRADAARSALKRLGKTFDPEIFALMEATDLYGDLEGLGYTVVQLKPRSLRKGSRPAQANIALLIRKDVQIKKRAAQRMREFWKGPKHGWLQDPRVNRWVKVRWEGKTWKVMAGHGPFGEAARNEYFARITCWLRRIVPGVAGIMVLDANMLVDDFDKKVSQPAGAKTDGRRIEVAAYKNCELKRKHMIDEKVSDHNAMYYTVTA